MRHLLTAAIGLFAGLAGAALWQLAGPGQHTTRDYLLANPEILPEAMEVLTQRQLATRIEPIRDQLEQPFPGAVLGNPQGTITLVEFSDYACGYCRQSLGDVNALIAANPDLKVVIREFPILSAASADAARMALAAAEQGRFAQFHEAMFAQEGPNKETIAAAARIAGVDLEKARAAIAAGAFDGQLQTNIYLAQSLGLTGTPGFIIGDQVLNGAVGHERMAQALASARQS